MSSTRDPVEAGPEQGPAFAMPDNLPSTTAIWLVRHGETEWSRSGQHTGRTDIPLTEDGVEQARALAPAFAALHPALVLCSPRLRAAHTAELAGLRVDHVDPDLAEWDYGDYEGLTSAQIHQTNPAWTLWSDGVPNGETAAQVTARADKVLQRALRSVADGPVVLVAHGHISRVLGARWIGLPASAGGRFTLGTAARCLLGAEHAGPVIQRWNIPNPLTLRAMQAEQEELEHP
jgi:probable phosphoglycerate mutase